jgi:mRNA interferase RelE/StbE
MKINSRKFKKLYTKIINDIYPILKSNPFYGVNIKKLKDKFKEIYRLRNGFFRLFYKIDESENTIFI